MLEDNKTLDIKVKAEHGLMPDKQLIVVDFAKFFFCVCIIAMHTEIHGYLPGRLPRFMLSIFNRGVQYFFVASGFFLGRKLRQSPYDPTTVVKGYCKRLFKPYAVFFACMDFSKNSSTDRKGQGYN